MTRGQLADDIILRLTQSRPSDDSEIEKTQIMYLLDMCRDNLVKQYLDAQLKAAQPMDSQYIERVILDASEESEDNVAADDERIYVTLTKQPLALLDDRGVVQVLTQEYLPVLRSRLENFHIYENLRFSKSSSKNLTFYRNDKKIIIKGLTEKNHDYDKFVVDYVPSLASQSLSESDDIKLSDALLPTLTAMVDEIMHKQMYDSTDDNLNDGVQAPSSVKDHDQV